MPKLTREQMLATITLYGWQQCGRAFYKMFPGGYLHATVMYGAVVRVWAENDGIWADPLPIDDERVESLYWRVVKYERDGHSDWMQSDSGALDGGFPYV